MEETWIIAPGFKVAWQVVWMLVIVLECEQAEKGESEYKYGRWLQSMEEMMDNLAWSRVTTV